MVVAAKTKHLLGFDRKVEILVFIYIYIYMYIYIYVAQDAEGPK